MNKHCQNIDICKALQINSVKSAYKKYYLTLGVQQCENINRYIKNHI